MSDRHDDRPSVEDVFENGFLRACLQDYRDDSFRICNTAPWTLAEENEYFRDLLNWEAAPVKASPTFFLRTSNWSTGKSVRR